MADELQIFLLGALVVQRGGRALPDNAWRSRQERRLLLILLAARGARVPADRLLDWLWPDADRLTGATTLRSAISGLRHTLEGSSGARASSRYILTRSGGYAWNTESGAWVDAEEFLALTDERPPLRHGSGQATDDRPNLSCWALATAPRISNERLHCTVAIIWPMSRMFPGLPAHAMLCASAF